MTSSAEPVGRLVEEFHKLPGIGPKMAQRHTYHLVRMPEDHGLVTALDSLSTLQVRTALMQRPLDTIDLRNPGRVYLAPLTTPDFDAREEAARS